MKAVERSPAAIEASIQATRERLGADIGALRDRLSPDALKRRARASVRRTALANVDRLVEFVKRNPVPATMIGAGVGWVGWLLTRQRDR
jgi:hypothetical protein